MKIADWLDSKWGGSKIIEILFHTKMAFPISLRLLSIPKTEIAFQFSNHISRLRSM